MIHHRNYLGLTCTEPVRARLRKLVIIIAIGLIVVVIIDGCGQSLLLRISKGPVIFSVMGDVPRSEAEKVLLQEQIRQHNQQSPAQFVFHVGDIKSGSTPCDEDNYALVADYLKQLTVPVFIVPGDNEWNDCEDPIQAWNYWEQYFMAFDQNWDVPFEVQRQIGYPVNSTFVQNEILFIALNLVGGRIHDQAEWDAMQQNAVDWIEQQLQRKRLLATVVLAQANPDEKHQLFMDQFLPLVDKFKYPLLFIHGDGHHWIYDDPWLVPNLIRIQVDEGGIADPLQVTVAGNKTISFEFERIPFKEIVQHDTTI
ncbi:MAG: hypothetical protein H8E14_13105 [Candidatus Marinimicrobia bacterium]|nr:hypothetical protein [Candidatus Neomarinimicrobiota bacterium]